MILRIEHRDPGVGTRDHCKRKQPGAVEQAEIAIGCDLLDHGIVDTPIGG